MLTAFDHFSRHVKQNARPSKERFARLVNARDRRSQPCHDPRGCGMLACCVCPGPAVIASCAFGCYAFSDALFVYALLVYRANACTPYFRTPVRLPVGCGIGWWIDGPV